MDFLKRIALVICIALCLNTFGQFGGDKEEDPDEGIPINSGIYALTVSGVIYFVFQYSRTRK